eukprot:3744063-Pleurochrysis_carterae.AAC.4
MHCAYAPVYAGVTVRVTPAYTRERARVSACARMHVRHIQDASVELRASEQAQSRIQHYATEHCAIAHSMCIQNRQACVPAASSREQPRADDADADNDAKLPTRGSTHTRMHASTRCGARKHAPRHAATGLCASASARACTHSLRARTRTAQNALRERSRRATHHAHRAGA